MQVLFWLLLGLLVGGIVAISLRDRRKFVVYLDLSLGAVGALIGGLLTHAFTLQNIFGIYDETILLVVIGAGFLIWMGRIILIRNYKE